ASDKGFPLTCSVKSTESPNASICIEKRWSPSETRASTIFLDERKIGKLLASDKAEAAAELVRKLTSMPISLFLSERYERTNAISVGNFGWVSRPLFMASRR